MSPLRKILSVVVPRALLGLAVASACAMFFQNASSRVSFTAGTVDVLTSPSSAALTLRNLAPGDSRYDALTISNAGTLAIRYKLSTSTRNADGSKLASHLQAEVRSVSGMCDAASFAASHDIIASSRRIDLLVSASLRVIAVGGSEVACSKFSMPHDTGNQYQNARTIVVMSINAIQGTSNA